MKKYLLIAALCSFVFDCKPSIAIETLLTDVSKGSDESLVCQKVDEYLNVGFNWQGTNKATLRIQYALRNATTAREESGTTDIILRNAEYYLHGLYSTSSGDVEHTFITTMAPIYVSSKYVAHALKKMGVDWVELMMRDNPKYPTSEPGGVSWAYRGLYDGLAIDGEAEYPQMSQHPFNDIVCKDIPKDITPQRAAVPQVFSIQTNE